MTAFCIYGPQIYTENAVIENQALCVENQKISEITARPIGKIFTFPKTYFLIPGRIDLHIHGLAGVDVMDATPETLATMTQTLPQEGTTSFLATTMSMPIEAINAAIKNVTHFMQHKNNIGARILGLHLEGPFIAPSKMGAHESEYLLKPDVQLMRQWQQFAQGAIKLVTLAPELENIDEFIRCLKQLNIVPSIGHSNATYAETKRAIHQGCKHVTHLFNAMSGLNHRAPGVALAALDTHVLAEIIADGHHVAWEMLQFVMRLKGKHELCVVTDSMRAKCMPDGEYTLGHQTVHVHDGVARLTDGTLAGSVLTMQKAVQNLLAQKICDLHEAIYLSSINAAKQLGIFDEVGSIAPGKYADLVVLNEKHEVVMTICGGEVVYANFDIPITLQVANSGECRI